MNRKRSSLFVAAAIAVMMLWPTDAAAQHRGHGRGPVVSVGVGFGYGHGYYSPFYNPFFFGAGFGWYSGYPWYPWGYGYPYSFYGYPYPYYGYYYRGWASARLEVKPRNAGVYLDGYYVGEVDQFDGVFQRLDLPPGGHELAIYLQGYRTYREKAMFRPGASYHFKAVLEPLPPGTAPEPQPQPAPGTEGRNPYAPQAHDPYAVHQPNPYGESAQQPYGGEGRTVPIPERRAPQRPPDVQVQPMSDFGTLSLRVQPADAIVTIDGERWDSPGGGSRLLVQLAAGQHHVEVRKDGYRPYSTTVELRPGETQTLNVSLPPGQDAR